MNLIFILLFVTCSLNQFCTLTPKERKEFLDLHNYLRRSVYPPAGDMQELEYDEIIEKSVNEYLEQCKFEHRKLNGFGENGRLSSDSNITNTVMNWFQERIFFNISSEGSNRCSKLNSKIDFLEEAQCGHYKMMVKSNLKSLGCGYKFCQNIQGNALNYSNLFITFCFYNSGQQDQPYKIGKPCSECSPSYQFCRDELCVPKLRYGKNLRTCKLKCQNCAKYFDSKNSCLCDCPDGTEGPSCKGTPTENIEFCSPCHALGLSCNSGTEDLTSSKCSCKCPSEYLGEYCQIKRDQFTFSYYHVIDGLDWRFKMMIPVNIVEFQKSFSKFQGVLARQVNEFCANKSTIYFQCRSIEENKIMPENVMLIQDFPYLLENGSMAIRMFINFSVIIDGTKQEKFVSTEILHKIWSSNLSEINVLMENMRKIFPNDYETSYPWALKMNNPIFHSNSFKLDPTSTNSNSTMIEFTTIQPDFRTTNHINDQNKTKGHKSSDQNTTNNSIESESTEFMTIQPDFRTTNHINGQNKTKGHKSSDQNTTNNSIESESTEFMTIQPDFRTTNHINGKNKTKGHKSSDQNTTNNSIESESTEFMTIQPDFRTTNHINGQNKTKGHKSSNQNTSYSSIESETTEMRISLNNATVVLNSTQIIYTDHNITTSLQWLTNSTNLFTENTNLTTLSKTTSIPTTTEKCANINKHTLNASILLVMLYISVNL